MEKERSYLKGEEAKRCFMETYGDVIETLMHMPRNTEEEKDARYSFFRQHQTDEMILLLFHAVKPKQAEDIYGKETGSENAEDDKNASASVSARFEKAHKIFGFFMDAFISSFS